MLTCRRCFLEITLVVSFLLAWVPVYGADDPAALMEKYGLQPGMKITKENAHLIKELVPESVVRRLEAGDYVMTIGKLDPPDILTKVYSPDFYSASEQNAGKFDVDADGGIIDKATGQRPWPMPYGLPFPKLDLTEDPSKLGAKIHWNAISLQGMYNDFDAEVHLASYPRWGAPNRTGVVGGFNLFPEFRREPVPGLQVPLLFQEAAIFLAPADAFGTTTLTWRWSDPKKWDSVWIYSPALRRIRRATAANRSDAVLGTEFILDDPNCYNGKIEMANWKFIGKQAMLMPFARGQSQAAGDFTIKLPYHTTSSSRYPQVPTAFEPEGKALTTGYDENPQQYASWWMVDALWAIVPAYVSELSPKDPYYNYGRQVIWYDATTFDPVWKVIYNRSGEYWRTGVIINDFAFFNNHGGKATAATRSLLGVFVDDKLNRGAVAYTGAGNKGYIHYNVGFTSDRFNMERFLQSGK